MSNTILISGASETLNVTVNPTLINVSVSIEEAAVTNTIEVNQFAGSYVSTIQAGDGILVSSSSGDTTISSSNSLSNNRFGVYESSNKRLVDAPAQLYTGSDSYIDFSNQDNNGSVQVHFNSKAEETVLLVPTSVNYTTASGIPNNVRSFTVYDSFRDLYYVGQNDGTNDFVTVINPDGTLNRTHTFEGISIFAQAQYSVSNDVVFAVSTRDDILYAFDPSDFSIIDSISTGVVDGGYISYWSENSDRLFLSYIQAGSSDGIVSFDFSNNSFSANGESSMEQPLYFLQSFIETSDGSLYAIDGFTRFSSYSSVNNSFSYVRSLDGFAPTMVYAPDTDKIWMAFAENASSTNSSVYEYDYNSDVLSLVAEFIDSGPAQVRYDEDLVWVIKPQATYSSDIGLTTVFDPVSKSLVSSFTEGNYTDGSRSPIINGGVLFDATGLYDFTFTEAQLHSRNYPSALKLTYGSYTQPEGDAPVDPKTDIELTVSGTNYVSHSGDTLSHHFFTNDTSGNDKKVLSIGNETLYVFNANGASSTVTKAKIDNWDLAGPGLESVSFNTDDGVLTITDTEDTDFTASLDGRYLQTETVTTISFANNVVSYVDEDGVTTNIDLSDYLDNTNDFVSSGTFTDGELTLSIPNQGDVIIDLDGRYLQEETVTSLAFASNVLTYTDEDGTDNEIDLSSLQDDTNDYVDGISFAEGTLTLTVGSQDDQAVSLDGRYLQSETTTTLSLSGDTLAYTDEEGTVTNINLGVYNETLTSISFASDTISYTDEDGTVTQLDLSGYNETITSILFVDDQIEYTNESGATAVLDLSKYNETITNISFNSATDIITYVNENGTELTLNLSKYNETLTSISFASNTITYTDEEGTDTTIDLSGYNETLTSISFTGDDITYTDEDGTDTVLDLSKYNETLTSISFASNTITYTDEDGGSTEIDLSGFNETLTSISFASNVISYVDEDGVTTDLNLSAYLDNENDFVTTASFTGGTLTLGVSNQDDVTVDLDGRYLQSETLTTLSFTGDDLTYTDEAGNGTVIDLSGYNETLTSISLANDSIAYVDENGGTTSLDLSPYLDDTNDFVTEASFIGGTLTLNVSNQDDIAVSLDGRYLQSETVTSISYAGDTITYIDEDGTSTDLVLSKYNETLTSLSFTGDNLTYTDEDGTANVISLSKYNETLTSLSYSSGTLTYTDEDGSSTNLDISGLSGDTTYDLASSANATAGADLKLTGSDSTTDTVNIVGTNAVTVTGTAGTITIDAPEETVTSISFASNTITYTDENGSNTALDLSGYNETLTSIALNANILKYTDEAGNETDINLSLYLDDTNLARLTSGTLNGTTGVATFTRDDATTFDLDLSALLDVNNYVDAVSFNASTGNLTLGRNGLSDLTTSLDGRYLTSEENDFLTSATFNTTNGELTLNVDNQSSVVVDLDGRYLTSAVDTNDYVTGASFNTGNGVLTLTVQNQSAVTVDLDNRYLTSYTETDTLDSVASRGNTTDQPIKIGEDGGDPLSELHVVGTLTIEGTDQNATSGTTAMQVQINDNKTALTSAQKAFITAKTAQTFEDKQVSLVSSSDANGGAGCIYVADSGGYAQYSNNLRMGGGSQGFVRYDVGKWSGTGTAYENISAASLEAFVVGRWESTGARTNIFKITTDGTTVIDGTIYADAFQNNSSIRYKENVEDLEDFTEAVMAMRPVRYDIKKNGKNDIGFIAEEVNELVPEVVGKNHDGEVESVDYARLSVVLLQQVQKQQSLIEKLEERISKLESK